MGRDNDEHPCVSGLGAMFSLGIIILSLVWLRQIAINTRYRPPADDTVILATLNTYAFQALASPDALYVNRALHEWTRGEFNAVFADTADPKVQAPFETVIRTLLGVSLLPVSWLCHPEYERVLGPLLHLLLERGTGSDSWLHQPAYQGVLALFDVWDNYCPKHNTPGVQR